MRFYLLLVLVPAGAFAAASLLAAAASAAAWPRVQRRAESMSAGMRARVVGALRLAPAATGAIAAAILSASFIRFEPRDTSEDPGVLLLAAAFLALLLTVDALRHVANGMAAVVRSSRLLRLGGLRAVSADGTRYWVLDAEYPVAAATGIFRSRLLLSTRLLHECTAGELDAILSHEQAHVRRRDNLVRAAIRYLPDPLRFTRAGGEMERAWAAAAEEAADDAAAGADEERRAALASALVRVARMATTPVPEWVRGVAFYERINLDRRVRRLLGVAQRPTGSRFHSTASSAAALAALAFAFSETAAREIHRCMELTVRLLP